MRIKLALGVAALTAFSPMTALATNGYFSHGYGTISKGMAGAGTALSQDSIAAATNPAGMAFVGNRIDGGFEVFYQWYRHLYPCLYVFLLHLAFEQSD